MIYIDIFQKRSNANGQQIHGKCSMSITIRKIQIKIIVRCYLTEVRTATLTKLSNKGCQGYKEKMLHTWVKI